jgi:hypothetical protein
MSLRGGVFQFARAFVETGVIVQALNKLSVDSARDYAIGKPQRFVG